MYHGKYIKVMKSIHVNIDAIREWAQENGPKVVEIAHRSPKAPPSRFHRDRRRMPSRQRQNLRQEINEV